MLSTPVAKAILGIGVVSGIGLTGGALSLYSKSKGNAASQTSTVVDGATTEEISESVTPIVRVKPQYNFAVMQEGSSNISYDGNSSQQRIKCKLEGTEVTKEFCALAKLSHTNTKKWIDFTDYGKVSFSSIIALDYITQEKTIYKVRVVKALIDAWEKEPTKNLQIFKYANGTDGENPLITLTPKFAVKNHEQFTGKTQYVVGKVFQFNDNTKTKFANSQYWYTCALPVKSGQTEVYKNCAINLFDDDETSVTAKAWTQKNLKAPLTRAQTIKKGFHYLISFDDETTMNDWKYAQNETLKVKIYSDWTRRNLISGTINEIHLNELSSVVLFEDHIGIDLALVL